MLLLIIINNNTSTVYIHTWLKIMVSVTDLQRLIMGQYSSQPFKRINKESAVFGFNAPLRAARRELFAVSMATSGDSCQSKLSLNLSA